VRCQHVIGPAVFLGPVPTAMFSRRTVPDGTHRQFFQNFFQMARFGGP
jgi:hypothetical protein